MSPLKNVFDSKQKHLMSPKQANKSKDAKLHEVPRVDILTSYI